jgi:hypothetical protein
MAQNTATQADGSAARLAGPFAGFLSMSNKEKVTIFISALALILSGLSLYFGQFYVSERLEVVVMEADPAGGTLVFEVAILNPGNRKALIKSADLILNPGDKVLNASNPLRDVRLKQNVPIVVDAKDIALLRFEGPIRFEELYQYGMAPDAGGHEEFDGEKTRKIHITATFESLDFRGIVHSAETAVMTAHITRSNVASWRTDGAKRSLFH